MKRLIIDLDNTITKDGTGDYETMQPRLDVVKVIREYKQKGFEIVINTSRNVRTYKGNVGKINANTLPVIISWLDRHAIPYDEVYVGKPWCGRDGFYVDDKSIRPSEFTSLDYDQILNLLDKEK